MTPREQCIGGSEVAALFGVSPYMTPYELWHLKKGTIKARDLSADDRIQAGNFLEPAVAAWVADKKMWEISKVHEHVRHPDPSIPLGGSLDYAIFPRETDLAKGPGVLEIKTVDWLIWRDWPDGEPPLNYQLQVQTYLAVKGWQWGAIGVLIGGNRLEVFLYERRPKTIALIEAKAVEFWKSIDLGIEPRPDFSQDGDTIARIYADARQGNAVDLSDSNRLPILCAEYLHQQEIESAAKARKETAKAEILPLIGDADRALCGAYTISAGMVAAAHVEFDRKAYRSFRLSQRKGK